LADSQVLEALSNEERKIQELQLNQIWLINEGNYTDVLDIKW
jgi:hypothetical protein